jgi:hypothetical protein
MTPDTIGGYLLTLVLPPLIYFAVLAGCYVVDVVRQAVRS